ncbi:keratin, type II cytoskeletal 2 epidermal [Salvelinus sp. IW2-2015]|uniref:keratin, type II cytoskeletal 2 epidermal n=1 Tax=Salvelinus sp. IW2-2015 TaxID=2691554 RepID=UPI000CDFBFBE|nr:keratin, type II cytoskeletal 2 epidermal [Salvelinus alpinus]
MKMKVQVRSLTLLAVAVLLVRSQNQTETRYEDIISVALPQLLPREEQAFRPILNQLQVETLNTEDVDQSEVSVRLSFPMQETFCSKSQGQPGKPCPLKKNGKLMMCSMKVRHPILEASNNLNTDLSNLFCEYMEAMQQKIRTRRSKARICSRGKDCKFRSNSRHGSGSRLGGGSLIGRPGGGSRLGSGSLIGRPGGGSRPGSSSLIGRPGGGSRLGSGSLIGRPGGGSRTGSGSLIGRLGSGSPPGGGSRTGGGSFIDGFIRDHRDGNRFA